MLAEIEEKSSTTIKGLKKKLTKLNRKITDYEEKLATKNEAINCLLGELAKRSHEIDSIGEMENVIQEIDDRMSERIDDRPPDRERVTRLLIGRIDNQELRFPLFKNRLTIGRTQQNDIQLKAQYISRRHAVITTEGDAARVIDWGSKNGVYVNSKRVTEHFLKNGDIVTIGIAEFRYEELRKRDT
jgi:chromosome segregation ATPase